MINACKLEDSPLEIEQKLELTSEARVFLEYYYGTRNRRKFLKNIFRANVDIQKQKTIKTQFLSLKAVEIANLVFNKLLAGKEVLLNYKYLSKITHCSTSTQNNNILNELANLFTIDRHRALYRNGNFYEHVVEIKFKAALSIELKDAGVFNSEFYPKFILSSINTNNNLSNRKNRSSQSSVYQNLDSNNSTKAADVVEIPKKFSKRTSNIRKKTTNIENKARIYKPKFRQYEKEKTLLDHYPLIKDEGSKLQSLSGRDFSLNAMNEILLDMSRKLERTFCSKAQFISYFAKCLKHEMRDAQAVSNNLFYIKKNKTQNELQHHTTLAERERYLEKIELNAIHNRSNFTQFKAKIAAVLPPNLAFNLLSHLVYLNVLNTETIIILNKQIPLSKSHECLLVNQAKAVTGCNIIKIEYKYENM
jgi:hypothetical protein